MPSEPVRETVEEERRHRNVMLAAAFRMFSKAGLDDGVAGHITARDPEFPDSYWVNADIARRQHSIPAPSPRRRPQRPVHPRPPDQLQRERLTALSALATMDATDPTIRPDAAEVDLLDTLPYLTAAPEALLRRLFEATNLTVRLGDGGKHVAISIGLLADTMSQIVGTVEAVSQTINKTSTTPSQPMTGVCADGARAPGRIRTCAPASGDR
jgi:hypothetical protein